jgi:predicted nucleic acid-binding protein
MDTSALGGIYLGDQADGAELAEMLYEGEAPVVTSELTDVEIASAFARAYRDEAIDAETREALLARYAADSGDSGPLGIIPLDAETLAVAGRYVRDVPVRTLDAIHLAACTRFAGLAVDEVRLLSRDNRQKEASRALGITVSDG